MVDILQLTFFIFLKENVCIFIQIYQGFLWRKHLTICIDSGNDSAQAG